jgi:uncharacterized membrane protein YdfJ with MMPL/SSD domain
VRALAQFTYLRAGRIALGAVLLLALAVPLAADVFNRVEPFDISDPDSEVERLNRAYEEASGQRPEPEVLLLVEPGGRVDSRTGRRTVEETAARLERLPGIARVVTPSSDPGLVADDGRAALLLGFLRADQGRVEAGERVEEAFEGDPEIEAGGLAVAAHQIGLQTEEDTRRIELYAAPVLLLLLLIVFGSPLAAALPLLLSGFSIVLTLALLALLSSIVDIDVFSLQVVTGLGVGLAIDYSLLVLARYRTELRRGDGTRAAQTATMTTAGRTVAFGALTVATALAALIIFPQQFLSSTGIAGAAVALISGAAAIFVLPALLALLGTRLDPGLRRAGRGEDPPAEPLSGGSAFWTRLSRRVMNRPVPFATLALALMLMLASPALDSELTTPDARVLPEERSARGVNEAVATRFGGLGEGRLPILVSPASAGATVEEARARIESDPRVEAVTPSERLEDGSRYLVALSELDPLSRKAQDLLEATRAAPWPPGTLVGGRSAELIDQRASIAAGAPLVIAIVVITNLLLVLVMARSVVLPLVSIGLNALTVAASYGIMVALFENEASAELLGTTAQDGVDISVPVLAFAVVFGLSTDYGIFLFSRIREARANQPSEVAAITEGLARTGRVITSAAIIFSVAVGANVFSDLVIVKEFAAAVAIAVLLDATVVRGLLVPAVLRLLGARAWWLPGRS